MADASDRKADYERALLDPASVFSEPEAVLRRSDLSDKQKIEILRRWEYDASEVAVAEEEGMAGNRPLMLGRVLQALDDLGAPHHHSHVPPTKQGGG